MSKKLFALAKTPIGDLIVGLAFEKFSKILPVKRIKETEKVVAFWHPRPFWEKHVLIVPKRKIRSLTLLNERDMEYINEVFRVASKLVKKLEWDEGAYSLLINGGKGQEVNQLHFHLAYGKKLRR